MSTAEHDTIDRVSFRQRNDSGVPNGAFELQSSQIRTIGGAAENPAANRKGLFASLLDALHASRRRQAARVIHQYRHLIATARSPAAPETIYAETVQPKGSTKMATNDDASGATPRQSNAVPSWALIAAVIAGFAVIHIAGEIIVNGSATPPAQASLRSLPGD